MVYMVSIRFVWIRHWHAKEPFSRRSKSKVKRWKNTAENGE